VSIGDTLADARRQGGLTVTQVSQQTRIRETIIKAIERGDFSPCGGDFYARGHIRSIASVVGTDPVPLIREYDDEHGPPGGMRAADIFEPATPIRIHEPRRFGFGKVLAVALLGVIGFAAYYLVSSNTGSHPPAAQTATLPPAAKPTPHAAVTPTPQPVPSEAVIMLTARQDCWVSLTSSSGKQLYQGIILAGHTRTWREKKKVLMVIGNPQGILLTVNGKAERMSSNQVAHLTIRPSGERPVTIG
jgi:cytoskeletal protein RodZ